MHVLIVLVLLLISGNFIASALVALGEVNVLRHTTASDVGQRLLGCVQGISRSFCEILDWCGSFDMFRSCT